MVLAIVRFAIASAIMLIYAHGIRRSRLPKGREWRQLAIYGLLNISVYLGCYVVAMQTVTAGIGSLAIATTPVFMSFLSFFFYKKKITMQVIMAIMICSAGVICSAWPLFKNATVTPFGLTVLLIGMLSYSVAAIYYSNRKWNQLDLFTINGWQTLIGGVFLWPLALLWFDRSQNNLNPNFWLSVLWLAIPVSIFAVQLWLWLLKVNAIRAGLWLFLCPLFGFIIAALILSEPLSLYTLAGVILVLSGLFISRNNA